jgi:Benzoyl-CoA reductase/2-hydroxyglutaryl-CoA dehydratase subunit, BcrC/BadD/HgdB
MNQGANRIITYACSFVPVEIIMASGLGARRIIPDASMQTQTQGHMHVNTCCYVKSLLTQVLDGQHAQPCHGIIIANCCDAMHRLHDLLEKYWGKKPMLFFDIPKKKDPDSIIFFTSEIKRLAYDLATSFHVEPASNERLQAAIRTYNEIRALMGQAFGLKGISGSTLFQLCLQGAQSEHAEFAAAIRRCMADAADKRSGHDARRILLTGNVLLHPDLITLVEDAGVQVVGLDICIGARNFELLAEEDTSDPFAALARRYLTRPACARMLGFDEQLAYLTRMYAQTNADGIICSSVKYCDSLIYTVPLLEEHCKRAGIPFLYLENEYAWADSGQIRTRIETFLEMLEDKHV